MCLAILPTMAYAQGSSIAGVVKDASGAVLPGVTVEAASRRPDRESPFGRHRRHRAVPDSRPAARHLHRHLYADRVQHRQTRRVRAAGRFRRHAERRSEGRRARGDDHRHRREPGRRRADREAAADARQRSAQAHSDGARLRGGHAADSVDGAVAAAATRTCS